MRTLVWLVSVLVLEAGCAMGRTSPDAGRRTDAPLAVDAGTDAAPLDAPIAMDAPIAIDARDGATVDARVPSDGATDARDAGTDARDAPASTDGGGYVLATWTTNATALGCTAGSTFRFHCPPSGTAASLWGTGEYTADSSICRAAVHAGRITLAAGGDVTITMRPGRSSYLSTTRNGITSSSWGTYGCSFAVTAPACAGTSCSDVCVADSATDAFACGAACTTCATGQVCAGGTCGCSVAGQTLCGASCVDTMTDSMHCGGCSRPCPATQACTAGACTCAPSRVMCPSSGTVCIDTMNDAAHCGGCERPCGAGMTCAAGTCGAMPATWSTTATAYPCPGNVGLQYTFGCPPGGSAGSLWGTDTYTNDSSICTAAVHAGRISLATGGGVTIEIRDGAPSYTGSLRNGITSSSYGPWSCSFVFP